MLRAAAQAPVDNSREPAAAIQSQYQELRSMVEELRTALAEARLDSLALRKEMEALRRQLSDKPPALTALAEEQRLLEAKVDEQYQTKVASGSRYRVRLSGMALFNAASTRGATDQIDSPMIAQPKAAGDSNGSFGATVRQSLISLEVFGPEIKGAKTRGELQFDFYGGFPATPEGLTAGFLRLRTAKMALDWKNTSLMAGQESPFFSPLSPTSLATVGYPAFSSSGNLWTWTPQVAVTHRINVGEQAKLSLQAGILDALTGELPASEYNRLPTAGERSRMPAYAARIGGHFPVWARSAAIGAGSYYARQNWGFGHTVDAWAATVDWNLPLGPWFSVSGEAYRGRAIGGLGGGPNASMIEGRPLASAGGWVQLKFKPLERLELNSAFGEDHGFRPARVSRNATGMFNVIYQPRGNLLFSIEYRRLRTTAFELRTADHINLGAGVIF